MILVRVKAHHWVTYFSCWEEKHPHRRQPGLSGVKNPWCLTSQREHSSIISLCRTIFGLFTGTSRHPVHSKMHSRGYELRLDPSFQLQVRRSEWTLSAMCGSTRGKKIAQMIQGTRLVRQRYKPQGTNPLGVQQLQGLIFSVGYYN